MLGVFAGRIRCDVFDENIFGRGFACGTVTVATRDGQKEDQRGEYAHS
jgi:hypothetical protein